MSEAKHTPGPWVLGKPGRNGEDEHMCEVMTAYVSGDDAKSYDLICECRKVSSVRIPVAEKIANAHLIAAAPDMLEALKSEFDAVLDDIRWAEGWELERLLGRRDRLSAIISKAKGINPKVEDKPDIG